MSRSKVNVPWLDTQCNPPTKGLPKYLFEQQYKMPKHCITFDFQQACPSVTLLLVSPDGVDTEDMNFEDPLVPGQAQSGTTAHLVKNHHSNTNNG